MSAVATPESAQRLLRARLVGSGLPARQRGKGAGQHSAGPVRRRWLLLHRRLAGDVVRPTALREAIYACRKGGSLFALGVFGALVDKFPFGAIMNKGMTVRGAQQHGHRYIPRILQHIADGELSTEHLATHVLPLDQGPQGYQMFKNKQDGCVRAVFQPNGATGSPS